MAKPVCFYFPSAIDQKPLFLANPIERVYTFAQKDVVNTLRRIDEWSQKKQYYIAGYIAYEAGYSLLGMECDNVSPTPLVDFYIFDKSSERVQNVSTGTVFFDFTSFESQDNYKKNFNEVHRQEREGNTYQVNYTYQNECRSQGTSEALFEKLYAAQTTPYAVFAQFVESDILSVSPELFFSKRGQAIQSKPMKGTLPLGIIDLDKKTSDKLQSENLMIVDLIRNDLSRLAQPETVKVKNLMAREQYPTLQQIVSTVEATLKPDTPFSQIIQYLFPCGSITGAPKRRTMEIIKKLESIPRGIYTGTIGYISPQEDMQFNVAIRTLVGREQWRYGVGGGLVLDSICEEEWSESLLKKQFIASSNFDFYIFETLLVKGGKVCHLELHLERLRQSAHFFGFKYNEETVQLKMHEAIANTSQNYRLRTELQQNGTVTAIAEPLQAFTGSHRITWASQNTDSKNLFYRYKTSRRDLYDNEFKNFREKGYYDILFVNEKNQLTEASRHNVFLLIDGQWYTPPLEVGILNGVERQKQIKSLSAKEKILFKSDVDRAQEILLTNSVRGCVSVRMES